MMLPSEPQRSGPVALGSPRYLALSHAPAQLRPFDPRYGSTVASWVRDQVELLWLAPGTSWPLTADKVVGWTGPTDRPLLLFEDDRRSPSGYAELNPLRESRTHLWIGHLIIAPDQRGRGLGRRFARMLVDDAFRDTRVQRVVMIVFPDNHAARRCYESTGFRIIRTEQHRFPPHRGARSLLRLEVARGETSPQSQGTAAHELPA
jgi:RimJ/RimL family protein N-acetyltransferase